MRSKIIGLLLLLSATSQLASAAIFPGGATIVVGNTQLPLANIVHLYVVGTAANTYMTFRQWSTSAGYVVPGGKSLRILAGKFQCPNSNATQMSILYGDNDVGLGTTVPTTPIYPGGVTPATYGFGNVITMLANTQPQENGHIDFLVPTAKYITLFGDATCAEKADLYGYLE